MAQVQNYMKKPVTIEAMLFEGGEENAKEIIDWILENGGSALYQKFVPSQSIPASVNDLEPLYIQGKPEGVIVCPPLLDQAYCEKDNLARPGDYVVKEKDGTFSVFSLEDLHNDYVFLD